MMLVPFDRDSFNKCLCGGCPVQRVSSCVREKEERLEPLKDDIEQHGKMPEPPQTVPGIYCSSAVGKSECQDLDGDRVCLCPACPVFLGHGLTNSYFCIHGSAERMG